MRTKGSMEAKTKKNEREKKSYHNKKGKWPMYLMIFAGLVCFILLVQYWQCQAEVKEAVKRLESYHPSTVSLSCGSMTYVDRGEGPVILVAHGITGGYDQGFQTLKDKTDAYRVLAPSRFGYLGSDVPESPAPEEQARAYAELLDALHINEVYILGTSAGGTIAIRFALDYPERTKGLILYSSAPPLTSKPDHYSTYAGPPSFLCNDFGMWLLRPFFEPLMGMSKDTIYDMLPLSQRKEGIVIDASIVNPDMAKNYEDYPIEELQVPTLIVGAEDDKLADFQAMKQAAERFQDCTLVSFPDGGHLMEGHGTEVETALDLFVKTYSQN